jgi:protein-disulfide isomerase
VIPPRRQVLAFAVAALLAAGPAAAAPAASGDMSLGSPRAKVKVVEYASLSCPHCAQIHQTVFPEFKRKYVDTGRVHFTLKEMLTPPAQVAAAGFLMARCAGPSKYFKVVDEVFQSQPRWRSGNIKPIFVEIARANGLSEAQFEACIADEKAQAALDARVGQAVAAGVDSTPTFFVNGKRVEVKSLADLDAAIAAAAK